MNQTTEDLLREVEAISLQIAELESAIEQAQSRGRELFREFQRRQVGLAASFGAVEAATRRSAARRQGGARPVASRIMVSATRLINELKAQKLSPRDIRTQVLATALKVAQKNGYASVPEDAIARIEAKIKSKGN